MGIKLMDTDGMQESDTLGVLNAFGVEHAKKLKRHEKAVTWAQQAVLIERKCLGEDSNEYQAAYTLLAVAQKCERQSLHI
jgi:hypothetical protein